MLIRESTLQALNAVSAGPQHELLLVFLAIIILLVVDLKNQIIQYNQIKANCQYVI